MFAIPGQTLFVADSLLMTLEILSGSPRQGSVTHRLALHLQAYMQQAAPQHTMGLISMQDHSFPPIQDVWTGPDKAPEEHKAIAERIFSADGFVLVTPEYNGSYAPALKNFLDHFPKQRRKPFGIATASTGAMGGMRASQQLLQLVPALFGIASPILLVTPMVDKKFEEDGTLLDESFSKSVHDFTTDFLWLAETLDKARV